LPKDLRRGWAVVALAVALAAAPGTARAAVSAPATPLLASSAPVPSPLSSSPLASSPLATTSGATWQTNGRVADLLTVAGVTYAAGEFTAVRPPGAAAGTQEVRRAHLAAFDSATGALLAWDPGADQSVYALAASPDGATVYVGGSFTVVGGQRRVRVAAVDAATGAVTAFRADTSGQVRALAAATGRVYLGGSFTSVGGQPRTRLAAVTTAGAPVPGWQPVADDSVQVLRRSADGTSVYAGGRFLSVNGNTDQRHLVKLSASAGDVQPWRSHPGFPVASLAVTGGGVWVGGDGYGGHAASYGTDGAFQWVVQTDGGVQAIALVGGVLYVGGHFDKVCTGNSTGARSGFECPTELAVRHKLLAVDAATGDLDGWDPGANSPLGVFALDAVVGRLHVGGTFTVLGGRAQQGFGAFR